MLCRDCNNCKGRMVEQVSTVYWCNISKVDKYGQKLGVLPHLNKPHPQCPNKLIEKNLAGKLFIINGEVWKVEGMVLNEKFFYCQTLNKAKAHNFWGKYISKKVCSYEEDKIKLASLKGE